MRNFAPGACVVVLLLGFGLKLDRALTQPLQPQAAATEGLARSLVGAGWVRVGAEPLLADGSLIAQGFQSGQCRMEVALLPPGPEFTAVLREAWGGRARFLHAGSLSADPPEPEGRLRNLARHFGASLGLATAPPLFGLAIATEGGCAGRLPPGLG